MAVVNPRTRLISFRVSEHEYARLRTLSNVQGAHSLADFIRASVCFMMDRAPHSMGVGAAGKPLAPLSMTEDPVLSGSNAISGQLFGLRLKAEALDREVRRLISMIERLDSAAHGADARQRAPVQDIGALEIVNETDSQD